PDMTPLRLAWINGDGISAEILASAEVALAALGPTLSRPVTLERENVGLAALEQTGTTLPDRVVALARDADGVVLGPVSHNVYPAVEDGGLNPSGVLRKALDLHANIRPAHTWAGVASLSTAPFDLIVVRENLEGFYADRNMVEGAGEFSPVPGVALALRKITQANSIRIAQTAFAIAATRPRPRVTAIHKANVMRLTDGLFLDTVREVARAHPDIAYDEMLVDAAAAHLVRAPDQCDVLVTTNMFGDILSDLASELSGGLGLAGSLNLGERHALAQAQHGSAPDIAGKDRANPTSMLVSLAMLLRHLGQGQAATTLEAALATCLSSPTTRTRDLGGPLGTDAFTQTLVATLQEATV
ncbi:MAG: isocitrate/isopropylmalate family dehydrogenase, partial [Pseudomonadota bacterium]